MHVMKKTVTSSNWASSRGYMVKKGVADFVEGVRLVCSVIIFNILCFFHGSCPEGVIVSIMQNIVLVSRAQLLNGEIVDGDINDNVVKHVGDFKSVIKTTSSTAINGDRNFDFPSGLACSSGKSSNEFN